MTLRKLNKSGFTVTIIRCDREFKVLMEQVEDELNIEMDYTATAAHVSEAERNNRTIAERVRCTYHNLPYKKIPKIMIKYMAMNCTDQLSMFPAKEGISEYYSPNVIIGAEILDCMKHYQLMTVSF